jgi:ribosomal protein S18 acetylase RimI-like enzyme
MNMILTLKDGREFIIRQLKKSDADALYRYFCLLSDDTKKRFGPHPFDRVTVEAICAALDEDPILRYVVEIDTHDIAGYALVKPGHIYHDVRRIECYGFALNEPEDCFYAPSLADSCQGSGLGTILLNVIVEKLRSMHITRMILWGGVQADNDKAVRYYIKNGFEKVGEFEYHGNNFDMIKILDH